MEFNVPKCKVLHMGPPSTQHFYEINGQALATTNEEKDIGVTITGNLKPLFQGSQDEVNGTETNMQGFPLQRQECICKALPAICSTPSRDLCTESCENDVWAEGNEFHQQQIGELGLRRGAIRLTCRWSTR